MYINLNSLTLTNFKGIKNMTVKFGKETNILGDNATGKSTINDAFRWVLFGKNSEDKTDFNMKPLTSEGKPIHNLETEVIVALDVDGIPTTFKRTLKEKWVKPKGQSETVMQGHETTYFYNDVPHTQREYMSKLDAICPESHFKLLTDPSYFPSLPWTKQRELLFGLAGQITDMDIAQGNPVFVALLENIRAKNVTLAAIKKELAAKRIKIKEDLEKIPTRIDELFRSLPSIKNWAFLEKEIADGEAAILEIDNYIIGKTTAQAGVFRANQIIQDRKNKKITRRDEIAFEVKSEAYKVINEAKAAVSNIKYTLAQVNNNRNNLLTENIISKANIEAFNTSLVALRQEWHKIDSETLTFKEYDFCCPTCAREYDSEKYEAIQAAMIAKFNENKVSSKKANELVGVSTASKRDAAQAAIDKNLVKIAEYDERILTLKVQLNTAEDAIPAGEPDITKLLEANTEYQIILKEIDAIVVPDAPELDIEEQKATKVLYQTGIDNAKKLLNDRDTIQKADIRIAELRKQQGTLAQEQADIEKAEFEVADFEKAKIETIESRVNSKFKLVRFKMFDQQINGGEVATCVCTVDGVPYPDLNNAMRINAGMDIINTLSQESNVYAPIFIDNRESVNTLADCQSQIINLRVTLDKQLKVA